MDQTSDNISVQYLPCLFLDGMCRARARRERFGGTFIAGQVPSQEETNILIAYFTWADNTEVEDAGAAIDAALFHYESVGDRGNYDGVDATTSASTWKLGTDGGMDSGTDGRGYVLHCGVGSLLQCL